VTPGIQQRQTDDRSQGGRLGRPVWPGSNWLRTGRVVVAGVVAALVAFPAIPAYADPRTPSQQEVDRSKQQVASAAQQVGSAQAQLALANAEMDQLSAEVEQAVEAYNGAVYRLQGAQEAANEAKGRSNSAKASLQAAQKEVGKFAAASYRSGGDLGQISMLVEADGPQALIDRANSLNAVGRHHDDVLSRVHVAQIVANLMSSQSQKALSAEQAAAEQVKAAKETAEAKVATQQTKVAQLAALRDQLGTQLAQAQSQSQELERQRQQGLAREAARKAAEAAAKKAAEDAARRAQQAAKQSTASAPAPSTGSSSSTSNSGGSGALSWTHDLRGGKTHGTPAGAQAAIDYARAQLGKWYEWAAEGPTTFDCSGLTMMAWRQGGVSLGHWTVAQYAQTLPVAVSDGRPGDLVFFATDFNDPATIYHVGLYLGGGQMIEAPFTGAQVRISSIYRASLMGMGRP
jgi:cell wall-associated NlpC family hydrolase